MALPSVSGSPTTKFVNVFVAIGAAALCLLPGCGGSSGGSGNSTVQQTAIVTTNPAVTAKSLYSADSANSTDD